MALEQKCFGVLAWSLNCQLNKSEIFGNFIYVANSANIIVVIFLACNSRMQKGDTKEWEQM
jgi:hypothetical protein